jgi:hypothetical protein
MALLALSLYEVASWWPMTLLWWSKPWLDRTVLFVLARAAFGQQTTLGDRGASSVRCGGGSSF